MAYLGYDGFLENASFRDEWDALDAQACQDNCSVPT